MNKADIDRLREKADKAGLMSVLSVNTLQIQIPAGCEKRRHLVSELLVGRPCTGFDYEGDGAVTVEWWIRE